ARVARELPRRRAATFLVSDLNHYLAEVLRGLQIAQRLARLVEREDAVDDRPQVVEGDDAAHLLEHGHGADVDALQADGRQKRAEVERLHRAGEEADDADLPAGARGFDRARQRAGASDFDDDVRPLAAREAQDFVLPLRRSPVVDRLVRAEQPRTRELLIAARRDDGPRAEELGKLQGEDRHTAGSEDDDRVAALDVRRRHQRMPRRERGAWDP